MYIRMYMYIYICMYVYTRIVKHCYLDGQTDIHAKDGKSTDQVERDHASASGEPIRPWWNPLMIPLAK